MPDGSRPTNRRTWLPARLSTSPARRSSSERSAAGQVYGEVGSAEVVTCNGRYQTRDRYPEQSTPTAQWLPQYIPEHDEAQLSPASWPASRPASNRLRLVPAQSGSSGL